MIRLLAFAVLAVFLYNICVELRGIHTCLRSMTATSINAQIEALRLDGERREMLKAWEDEKAETKIK